MRRILTLLTAGALTATLVRADQPAPALTPFERLARWQANRALIELAARNSLRLADEPDPLRRAGISLDVVEHLAQEIRRAAQNRQAARAVELSQHLHKVLGRGVAANLRAAALTAVRDSPEEQMLLRIGQRVEQLVGPLEEPLGQATDPEFRDALQTVRQARAAAADALRGHRPGPKFVDEPPLSP